jgi:uncharacterized protein (UPF0248 family)
MIPVHELLNRIRWDPEFGRGEFEIGYYDRVRGDVVRVPLREVCFPPGEHFSFVFIDTDGVAHDVPLHRIRQVFKDGHLIWSREHNEGAPRAR